MSASREFFSSDDHVVLTMDIEDSPLVEFPLRELFDNATSTVVVDYLQLLHDYVTQAVEDTTWLDKQSKSHLLSTRFGVFYRTEDGVIVSMRQPALQRRITQILRSQCGSRHPIEIPIFISFLCSDVGHPPRRTRFPLASLRVLSVNTNKSAPPTTHKSFTPSNEALCGLGSKAHVPAAVLFSTTPALDDSRNAMPIIPEGTVTPGLNDSRSANEVDVDGSTAAGGIPHAVMKDTDGRAPRMAFSASKRSDFGPLDSSNSDGQNGDNLCNDVLADGYIVIVDGNGDHKATTTTTGTDVQGTFPLCAIINRITNTHFHEQMQPVGDTAPFQIASKAVLLLLHHHGPSPFARHRRCVSLRSELMRYHPIDRGRCCHLIATCTHSLPQ
jgi:hypothetical protein